MSYERRHGGWPKTIGTRFNARSDLNIFRLATARRPRRSSGLSVICLTEHPTIACYRTCLDLTHQSAFCK